jgi:hypothetical protein
MSLVGKICGKLSPRRRRRRVVKPIESAFTFNAKQCLYNVERMCVKMSGKHKVTAHQYYIGAKLCVDSMTYHETLPKYITENYQMKLCYVKHVLESRLSRREKARLAKRFRKSL